MGYLVERACTQAKNQESNPLSRECWEEKCYERYNNPIGMQMLKGMAAEVV
jgi:hypothetical protein